MIYCQKCRTPNNSTALICEKCEANLLPALRMKDKYVKVLILTFGGFGTVAFGIGIQQDAFMYFCTGIGILLIIYGIVTIVRKPQLYERYIYRAKRHVNLDYQQAICDYRSAVEVAPDNRKYIPIKAKAKNIKHDDAAFVEDIYKACQCMQKDRQSLVRKLPQKLKKILLNEVDRQKKLIQKEEVSTKTRLQYTYLLETCYELIVPDEDYDTGPIQAVFTGVKIGIKQGTLQNEVNSIRSELVKRGIVQIFGFCPGCKDIAEFDNKMRCLTDSKKMRGLPSYVMQEDSDEIRDLLRKRYVRKYFPSY